MAALFYLPRLFVYHAKHNNESYISSVFKVMESKLYGVIATPSMIIVWVSGLALIYYLGIQKWLILKNFICNFNDTVSFFLILFSKKI